MYNQNMSHILDDFIFVFLLCTVHRITLDTVVMEAHLPKDKLDKIQDQLELLVHARKTSLRQLQSVIGLLYKIRMFSDAVASLGYSAILGKRWILVYMVNGQNIGKTSTQPFQNFILLSLEWNVGVFFFPISPLFCFAIIIWWYMYNKSAKDPFMFLVRKIVVPCMRYNILLLFPGSSGSSDVPLAGPSPLGRSRPFIAQKFPPSQILVQFLSKNSRMLDSLYWILPYNFQEDQHIIFLPPHISLISKTYVFFAVRCFIPYRRNDTFFFSFSLQAPKDCVINLSDINVESRARTVVAFTVNIPVFNLLSRPLTLRETFTRNLPSITSVGLR